MDAAVQTALQHNQTLIGAQYDRDASRWGRLNAITNFLPKVELSGGVTRIDPASERRANAAVDFIKIAAGSFGIPAECALRDQTVRLPGHVCCRHHRGAADLQRRSGDRRTHGSECPGRPIHRNAAGHRAGRRCESSHRISRRAQGGRTHRSRTRIRRTYPPSS